MNNKIYSTISLAQKAGKLFTGEDTCIRAIKAGKGKLVIVAQDSSPNTKKQFKNMCQYRNIPYWEFGSKELLGKYCGKEYRAVVCVNDDHFARLIIQKLCGGE